MSDPAKNTKPNKPRRFQFTIRFLLLLPLGIVAITSTGHWFGPWWAFLVTMVCVGGLFRWVTHMLTGRMVEVASLFGVVVLLMACLPLVLGPFVHRASPRAACQNNLHQIGIALLMYEDDHGCFPPAVVTDESGRPLHGWRTAILPYMGQQALYDEIDLSVPWDAPENQHLAPTTIPYLVCPAGTKPSTRSTDTSYVAIIGPDTAWAPDDCRSLEDLSDGPSNTILLVEVADSGIHWMEPRDLTLDDLVMAINATPDRSVSSHHRRGANVLFADGSIRFLPDNVLEETLQAMLTANGGETIDEDILD